MSVAGDVRQNAMCIFGLLKSSPTIAENRAVQNLAEGEESSGYFPLVKSINHKYGAVHPINLSVEKSIGELRKKGSHESSPMDDVIRGENVFQYLE